MKVAIYSQHHKSYEDKDIKDLLAALEQRGISYAIEESLTAGLITHATDDSFKKTLQQSDTYKSLDDSYGLMLSLGGDGTILRGVSYLIGSNIPILGINTGRLGFLSTVQPDEVEQALDSFIAGKFSISRRSLLKCTVDHDEFSLENPYALNEISVSRKNTTSMISVETELDNEYLTTYWADGLIVSTPTGSTGYSLSCGGPVLSPQTQAFALVPIAPHNLNARPLVIPDVTKIKLTTTGREEEYLVSLDNRILTLPSGVPIYLELASYQLQMITIENTSFINTLRNKLLWGADKRN